jgi:catechol 2,3-dioxygenase-like lactoylglutathione lyase family enzyme
MKATTSARVLFGITVLGLLSAAPTMAAAPGSEVVGAGNFIHIVGNLGRTIEFYHDVLGLPPAAPGGQLPAPKFAPNLPVAQLYAVPPSTPVAVAVFRLPERGVGLEFAEFRNVDQRSARPRPQDPGAAVLILEVRNLDSILARAHAAHVAVVTAGGAPVAGSDAAGKTRSIVIRDPDGYYIELVEHEPAADSASDGGATGNVLHARLMLSVADTDLTVHFYRDLLGLPLQVDAAFAPDAALSRLMGVPHARFRHSIATVPGTDFGYDFVEWKGVGRRPDRARVFDHGVDVLRIVVGNVDTFVAQLKSDGIRVASSGDGIVALNAAFHASILADPNGLYVEPVPHFQPRRPQPGAQAPRAQ